MFQKYTKDKLLTPVNTLVVFLHCVQVHLQNPWKILKVHMKASWDFENSLYEICFKWFIFLNIINLYI